MPVNRPFRLVDGMILIAATAVAFAIFRQGLSGQVAFSTFGGNREQFLFYWMHQIVPFPAMLSIALFGIAVRDRRGGRRRKPREAGAVACCAAVVALTLTTMVASTFYTLHVLEELRVIPRIFSHMRNSHAMPPFANAPMEEIVGASVLGAWSAMAASGSMAGPAELDRPGRSDSGDDLDRIVPDLPLRLHGMTRTYGSPHRTYRVGTGPVLKPQARRGSSTVRRYHRTMKRWSDRRGKRTPAYDPGPSTRMFRTPGIDTARP